MSEFSRFMKQNKVQQKNEKYAPTESLVDENGKPLDFEFKHLSSKENDELRDKYTVDVQVTGKPNMFRPKLNTYAYLGAMVAACVVVPNLYDAELQNSYKAKTPEELLHAMVDNPGEYDRLVAWVQQFNGLNQSLEDKSEKAKN